MNTIPSQNLILLIVLPLIGWRLFVRFRRLVGRQRMSVARTWFRIVLFCCLVLLLAAVSVVHPLVVAGLIGGVAIGAGLGIYGIRKTRFEASPAGLFYTPHAGLGIALGLLFTGRIVYRLVTMRGLDPAALSASSGGVTGSVTTLAIFGLLAGYYVSYGICLLRWQSDAARSLASAAAPALAPAAGAQSDSAQ